MSDHVSTTRAVIVLIGVALILVGAGFAVPGWLTNRPDGAKRFRRRFLCFLSLLAGWFLIHDRTHGWLNWALYLSTTLVLWAQTAHWYRATEKARKAEAEHARLVAALRSGRPMWLPNDGRGVSGG